MKGLFVRSIAVIACSVFMSVMISTTTWAQLTFVVNSTADAPALAPGSGNCNTANSPTECTLRAAIEQANATAVNDTIRFAIPGTDGNCSGGICTIMPDGALPDITEEIWIDATDVPGASCLNKTLKVVIDGTNAGNNVSGLKLYGNNASDSYIGGLVVHSFDRHGVEIFYSSRNIVSCNLLGIDADGVTLRKNRFGGVRQEFGNSSIIGVHSDAATDYSEGNVIAGGFWGVFNYGGLGNRISGNAIGGNVAQTDTVGSSGDGIVDNCGIGTIIGTNNDGKADGFEPNIVIGNESGVVVSCGSPATMNYQINRNLIGMSLADVPLGNRGAGIRIITSSGSTQNGSTSFNRIGNNGGPGIGVENNAALVGHKFLGNSIKNNGGLGIDLGMDGITPNDLADADVGPNKLQNTPVLTEVLINGSNIDVSYYIDSDPANVDLPIKLELFYADADGEEGEHFLGSDNYFVGDYSGCGLAPCIKTVTLPIPCDAGDKLVATATSAAGNTSEFSQAVVVADKVFAVALGAFLEGAWLGPDGVAMSNALRSGGLLPYQQPFSDPMYDGTDLDFDSLQTAPLPPTAVDWVLVSLRTGTSAATEVPGTKHAAWIDHNGSIRTPGSDSLSFGGVTSGPYYLVLQARNHLGVMSSSTMPFSGQKASWYFWSGSGQAYGLSPMKAVFSDLTWALFAGDGNADGQVTAPDFNLWNAATTAGATGYEPSDYNFDGIVTAPDFNLWNANTTAGASSKVPG